MARTRMIIFDLHETLASFDIDYDLLRKELKSRFDSDFARIIESINKLGKNERKAALDLLDDVELASLGTLKLKRYARKVLDKAEKKKYITCLVTLQGRKAATEIIERLHISSNFDCIVTRDEIASRKEQISYCLQKFGVEGKDAMMIGDKKYDYFCAVSLQCKGYILKREPGIPFVSLNRLAEVI